MIRLSGHGVWRTCGSGLAMHRRAWWKVLRSDEAIELMGAPKPHARPRELRSALRKLPDEAEYEPPIRKYRELSFTIMNLSDPTRAVTPTLDGPVLAVLAAAGRPLTVGEVAAQVVRGSEIGVRRCLARLVDEGIVIATEVGRNRVHLLNRDHLAADIAEQLGQLRPMFFERLRKELARWRPKPCYACVFGSAARGDGDEASDVDLLLVHGPFPGDPKPPRQARVPDAFAQWWSQPMSSSATEAKRWPTQIERLKEKVRAWTGNTAQVVDLSWAEWLTNKDDPGLFAEIRQDAIDVTPRGPTVTSVLTGV